MEYLWALNIYSIPSWTFRVKPAQTLYERAGRRVLKHPRTQVGASSVLGVEAK